MEDSQINDELNRRGAHQDWIENFFPKPVRDARKFLLETIDNAIDNHVGIPGVVDDPSLIEAWLEGELDGKPSPKAQEAFEKLASFVAEQYGVTPQQIKNLQKGMVDAFLGGKSTDGD